MKWHEEVLTTKAINAFKVITPLVKDDFYLAGGTALALLIGHRISLDFDLFSLSNKLQEMERTKIVTMLGNSNLLIRESSEGTLHITLDGIFISLFSYPYKLLDKPSGTWVGIKVASILDIAAMKLSAIQGRGSRKDFIDLYFISKKIPLIELLQAAEKKFNTQDNFLSQTCKALVYFEDADREPMPKMKAQVSWPEIKLFFKNESKRVVKTLL